MQPNRTGQNGFALVLTLVVTALMVAVLVELVHQVYVDTSISRGFRDGQQASLFAESGITGGIKLLQLDRSSHSNYTSLSDKWALPFKLDDESGSIVITATEESSKVNINDLLLIPGNFTWETLKKFGKQHNIPDDCWSALGDWIDADDQTSSGGAETAYYKLLKPSYAPRNAKLNTLAELSLIKGFVPEIITILREHPCITVFSENPAVASKININTASQEVIEALTDKSSAAKILEKRRMKPFENFGETGLPPALTSNISFKGSIYRIVSVAKVKDTARTVEAIISFDTSDKATILSWQEY